MLGIVHQIRDLCAGGPRRSADNVAATADEAELARLGAELLAEPDTGDTIGDVFDAVVGPDPHGREKRASILDASWSGIGPGVD